MSYDWMASSGTFSTRIKKPPHLWGTMRNILAPGRFDIGPLDLEHFKILKVEILMKLTRQFTLLLTVVLSTVPLIAQDQPERNRRGDRPRGEGQRSDRPPGPGPGGMMGGMFGSMMGGGALQLMGLLRNEDVRKEIDLSDDVFQAIQDAQGDTFSKMRGLRDASEEDQKKIMEEVNSSAQDLMDEVFTPDQQKRLMGLLAQIVGPPSVMNSLIAKELSLPESTRADLAKEAEAFGTKMREMFTSARENGSFPDFSKIQESLDEFSKNVESKLSDSQKKAFEQLKGEKTALADAGIMGLMGSAMGGGGFGGRGGPGGPGGNRDGERPPRQRRGAERD